MQFLAGAGLQRGERQVVAAASARQRQFAGRIQVVVVEVDWNRVDASAFGWRGAWIGERRVDGLLALGDILAPRHSVYSCASSAMPVESAMDGLLRQFATMIPSTMTPPS